jgi:hypothetical protein
MDARRKGQAHHSPNLTPLRSLDLGRLQWPAADHVESSEGLRRLERTRRNIPHLFDKSNACARVSLRAGWKGDFTGLTEGATMSRVKQASKQKRTTKAAAVKAIGAAGLSFSMVGGASASAMPTADIPQFDINSTNQRFVLSEEEMADVSLATFYVFDKENIGGGVQLARGCGGCGGCGGCRGCGGGGGFRGCGGGGCRGCVGCRGCGGFRGCGGCGCGIGLGVGGFWFGACGGGCSGCCASWGACRWC